MLETYRGVAHPWLCDAFGHLNTRHHLGMFDDALHHYMQACGTSFPIAPDGCGFADVSANLTFHSEVAAGSLLVIRSRTERIGDTSVTSLHEMMDASTEAHRASCRIVSVQFDLSSRRPTALSSSFREAATRLVQESPAS